MEDINLRKQPDTMEIKCDCGEKVELKAGDLPYAKEKQTWVGICPKCKMLYCLKSYTGYTWEFGG